MKNALVTGASSGIGYAVCNILLEEGYHVLGIGRNFSKNDAVEKLVHAQFQTLQCDLRDQKSIDLIHQSVKERGTLDILIHAAGVGRYGSHEQLTPSAVSEMVEVNLIAPMLVTRDLLKFLREKKGQIIFISSIASKYPSKLSACYGATKAGLNHFALSLFEEVRKEGVRVSTIIPGMTDTSFHDSAWFEASKRPGASLSPDYVAQEIMTLIKVPEGSVIKELLIEPQFHEVEKKPRG